MLYAPIIIFAFNRLDSLKRTVASVLQNEESSESDLFVFVDGARDNEEGEKERVFAVHEYVKTISGFKTINYKFSNENKGLGVSVIAGVSEVINTYGSAIVLEDDLILSSNCISFMNQGLKRYKDEKKVFSVCGFSLKVKVPKGYVIDSYFSVRSSSWGWATWADRWNSVDWELNDWQKCVALKSSFNRWGGSDCFGMLKDWKEGRNESWAIRFCFSQFLQQKLSLFPIVSKINNDGFNGDGTNCRTYSRFKFIFDITNCKQFLFPESLDVNKVLYKSSISYHSIMKRIWSKIMYKIVK